ncbi:MULTISPECIES: hypothetical protein [Streptomyces]|uniref:hypothetical protein n=1 Tax=Streptomyces TaxID=1883 RepID=UPI0004CD0BE7|nr:MULTISPECIES: hypothetical protein [Streptomyces]KOT64391.1 hypothetical protein ADK43_06110 [Streptomyces rimosus subsp. rimosus]
MAVSYTASPFRLDDATVDALLGDFYRTARAGGLDRLAGGGGPLGFDITTACQLHALVEGYGCDGIVESGCHRGDTSEYLARAYPRLPLRTCDLDARRAAFTRARLARYPNARVEHGDSAQLLPGLLCGLARPLVLLDAHWGPAWPLRGELAVLAAHRAVVVIDDFAIGHPRFGYDTYDGVACGPHLVAAAWPHRERMFVGDVEADYPLPCLQTGRRSGTGVLASNLDDALLAAHPWFAELLLRPRPQLPAWRRTGARR